jgi:DNA primase
MRRLALEERPLADVAELVVRLKVRGIERRIDTLRATLETLDPDADQQGYSETFAELIALERQRREMRREM